MKYTQKSMRVKDGGRDVKMEEKGFSAIVF